MIGLVGPGQDAVGQIVEHEITFGGADHCNEVVLTRGRHHLAQQNGARGPAPGDQLMALGDGVIVAIAAKRAQQPFFASEAFSCVITWSTLARLTRYTVTV